MVAALKITSLGRSMGNLRKPGAAAAVGGAAGLF